MFWVKKATAATAALVAVFGLGLGVGVTSRTGTATAAGDDKPAATPQAPPPVLNTRLSDVAYIELHECESALRAAFVGYGAVKQQLDAATPGDARHAELTKNLALLQSAFEAARMKVHHARVQLAEAKGKQVPGGDLASLKQQLKELAEKRREAADRTQRAVAKADTIKELFGNGAAGRASYTDALKLVHEAEIELAAAKLSHDALAAVVRERESMPTGACLVVTAVPLAAAGEWVVSEYGPDGKLVGTLTAEHGPMLARFLARSVNDPAAPKELRVVIRDGASLNAAFTAVSAAKEAGFKKVKFTGTVPSKGNIPAGAKDLPRRHLEDADTDKLYQELLGNLMKC